MQCSTAALNPLSLSYCIPPESKQALFIPIIFNNSIPDHVSYYIRSLETGHAEVKSVAGSSMKRATSGTPRLQITSEDEDEENASEPEANPLSALILRGQAGELNVAKLPSVKPSDSLAHVPQNLASSQTALFLKVDKPGAVYLKTVTDKRGDRFHIVPHKEAIVVECPNGGHWMENARQGSRAKTGKRPAETRCVGDEETAYFEARGVGSLTVGWRKKFRDSTLSGTIEGIEDEIESVGPLALTRLDRVSKTHTAPLRLVHDRPGVYTVSLTSVTDSLHNSYIPTGPFAEKAFNVISRSSARFDCPGPREIVMGKTTTLPVILDESGTDVEVMYSFKSTEGEVLTRSLKTSRRTEAITISEPGTYTLVEVQGPCSGSVMEPSTCVVHQVPPPALELQVTTLHEWWVVPLAPS